MTVTAKKTEKLTVPQICDKLQQFQKQRAWYIKTKNMVMNRLRATIAMTLGYGTKANIEDIPEKERRELFKKADEVIKEIIENGMFSDHTSMGFVQTVQPTIEGCEKEIAKLESSIRKYAKQLPIADWIEHKDQKGISLQMVGVLIGETGDLSKYSTVAKVWKRMGLLPYTSAVEGRAPKTKMGSTWRKGKEGSLSSKDWEAFGYSPRRRSIAYLIGENFVKAGQEKTDDVVTWVGPYRRKYDETKQHAANTHPQWAACPNCEKKGTKTCSTCKGEKVMKRCHLHAMLITTKMFIKNLWLEWHGHPPHPKYSWYKG